MIIIQGVDSYYNTVITAILLTDLAHVIEHVFHTDIFCTVSGIFIYSLLYIMTHGL